MTTTTQTLVSDIPRESIKGITWISLRGEIHRLKSEPQINYWLAQFGSVPVQTLDGGWCSIESSVPYRSFEVFVK